MRGWGLIYDSESGTYEKYRPYKHNGTSFQKIKPYVYRNGAWILCGSTKNILVPFTDSDGNRIKDTDGNYIYIEEDSE